MAGHSYMTTGYSNYNDLPPQEDGYFYGQGQNVNWYVVETTTVERVRIPSGGYTSHDGALMDHHGGYALDYSSNYEISSPRGYHEQENLMNDFLNKIHIGASRPMKPSNLSGPNRYRPTSPNKYHPTSLNKYRPTSPSHGYPTRDGYPISGQNLQGQTKYRPTSPTKYRPMGPITYRPTSPHKYRPTSPTHNYPSKDAHMIKPHNMPELNRYRPTSPTKYRPTSPTKYRPTNPIEYRETSPAKYQPTNPTHNYPSKEDNPIKGQNLSGWNKYMPTSPVFKFPSKEIQPVRTQRFSSPDKQNPSSPGSEGQHARLGDFSSPRTPNKKHQLPSPTNNINEAFDHLTQPMNNSPRSEPKRDGVFNNIFSRAQPIEPEGRYAKPTVGHAINKGFFRSNTIDSEEAVKKYSGANVP